MIILDTCEKEVYDQIENWAFLKNEYDAIFSQSRHKKVFFFGTTPGDSSKPLSKLLKACKTCSRSKKLILTCSARLKVKMSWYVIHKKSTPFLHIYILFKKAMQIHFLHKKPRRNQFGISFSLIHWHENKRFVRFEDFKFDLPVFFFSFSKC